MIFGFDDIDLFYLMFVELDGIGLFVFGGVWVLFECSVLYGFVMCFVEVGKMVGMLFVVLIVLGCVDCVVMCSCEWFELGLWYVILFECGMFVFDGECEIEVVCGDCYEIVFDWCGLLMVDVGCMLCYVLLW